VVRAEVSMGKPRTVFDRGFGEVMRPRADGALRALGALRRRRDPPTLTVRGPTTTPQRLP
jgi:hypothetical protein